MLYGIVPSTSHRKRRYVIHKSYRFRIYPTPEQALLFEKTFGCCRFVWNHLLDERQKVIEITGKMLNSTPAYLKKDYPFLKEIDSMALCNVQINLNSAFRNHRTNPNHFEKPKFKTKHHSQPSYTTNLINGNIRISDNGKTIRLPKVGEVSLVMHRQIPKAECLKAVTVSRNTAGKYHVSVLVSNEKEPRKKAYFDEKKVIGLDYSSPNFYVDSNGNTPEDHKRWYRDDERKLSREQRKLSKMKTGSQNWQRQKIKVGAINTHITDRRKDWLEKESASLAEKYDAVVVEGLDMQEMSQKKKLGKSTTDNGWGMFRLMLERKLTAKGKTLVILDKWTPSTKKCCRCGSLIEGIKLSDRLITCQSCGNVMDRDVQAAINIRNTGIKQLWDAERKSVDTGDISLLEQKTKKHQLQYYSA